MVIRPHTLNGLSEAYHQMDAYYTDIRALFDFVDIRFRLGEYGVRLAGLGDNRLHSNASGFILADDSPYPFYLWTPSWLGRFYVDPLAVPGGMHVNECPAGRVGAIAFIWPWLGLGDAYVQDVDEQECWVGVAETHCDDPNRRVADVADMMWKFFRVESTCSGEEGGWLVGEFHENDIGCTLTGTWFLRRLPLRSLGSFYEVNRQIVHPLSAKYRELARPSTADVSRVKKLAVGGSKA